MFIWGTFALGVYVLQPQTLPSVPTPVPTAVPIKDSLADMSLAGSGQPVRDPTSAVIAQPDPKIAALLQEVSTQSLMAYVIKLESFSTRNSFSLTERDDFGIGAARRWLMSEFERVGGGRLQVEAQEFTFNFLGIEAQAQNIIATLPGTGPSPEIILMVAHYDTSLEDPTDGFNPMPGADDNASSLAAFLEIARLMSVHSWNHTIIFVATTAEEQGNYGSSYFVRQALLNDWPIRAVLNNDMIGGRVGIPPSVRIFSQGPDTSPHRQLARYIDFVGGLYLPTFPTTLMSTMEREGRWGDHVPFA